MIIISKKVKRLGYFLTIILFLSSFIYLFNFNTDLNNNFIDQSNFSKNDEFNDDFELGLSQSTLFEYSGVGNAQNVAEYGEAYFLNNDINITNNENASIIIPNGWEGNAISCDVTNIYEYNAVVVNQTFDIGIDQNRWTNTTTGNPTKFTVGYYNNPTGSNDSIYLKLDEDGGNWQDTSSLINYSFPLLRESIPYEDWYIKYSVKWIMTDNSWRDDLPPGSKYVMGLEFSYNDGSSTLREFNLKKPTEIMNNTWYHITMLDLISPFPDLYDYNPPANVSIYFSFGVKDAAFSPVGSLTIYYDNISFEIQSIPKPSTIGLNITDNASDGLENQPIQDFPNLFGKGNIFLEGSWSGEVGGSTYEFSFSSNSTGNVLINTNFFVMASSLGYTSTNIGTIGSEFIVENGTKTIWIMNIPISIPGSYSMNYYFNVSKPLNWNVTQVIDPYSNNKINEVIGAGLGNSTLTIPNNIITGGVWKIVAEAPNYVELSKLFRKNATIWSEDHTFHIDDKLRFNASIKTSLIPSIDNTKATLKIFGPNGSLWYQEGNVTVDTDGNVEFSEIILGKNNASAGKYYAQIIWHDYDINMSQVGFSLLEFKVLHKTNLTAINSHFEQIAGDPLLIKVKFVDYDLNTSIDFATITYNSTFEVSGTMSYQGFGIYVSEVDTKTLGLGDYYFSFNASKSYYESQTAINLIHLKIIAQPLALELPKAAVYGIGNDYAICQINVTGAFSGSLIWPVNISTDWQNPYQVTDHYNGTFTLNFSTSKLPSQGIIETFTVSVFANKRNYGDTSGFITIIIYPIETIAYLNSSIVYAYLNEDVDIKVNYTIEGSGTLISGANCSVSWIGSYHVRSDGDSFIVNLDTATLSIDAYTAIIKLEKPGFETIYKTVTIIISEQNINLNVYINSVEISEDSLIELYFNQEINILVRVYAVEEKKFLSGGVTTFISDNFEKNLTEASPTYFNTSIGIDISYFNPGINNIYLKYQKQNYSTTLFSFQFFISEQDINLTVYIDSVEISENSLSEFYFKEEINIVLRAFAIEEEKFLSGGIATFIRGNFEKNLTEISPTYYNISIRIDSSRFNPGLNQIFLLYQKLNYTTKIFSFQFLIYEQDINLTVYLNSVEIDENSMFDLHFNDVFMLSCKAYAEVEQIYLDHGTFTFVSGSYQKDIQGYANFWFNTSISIDSSYFSLGLNYVYIEFAQTNYTKVIFSFQIFVNQINIDVKMMNFQDSIEVFPGETILIKLNLTEQGNEILIENVSIFYWWEFGIGYFDYVGNGIYELELLIPGNIKGNYKITLIISKQGSVYQTTEFSFIISINEKILPNYVIWYIIIGLIIGLGLLGILSFRAYVFLPVKRRKASELLAKTQRFKDAMNILGTVISQRETGISLYTKSHYALETYKKELLSGFIYAITTISSEFIGTERSEDLLLDQDKLDSIGKIIELDFKHFNFLICDYGTFRCVFILKNGASNRLKKQAMDSLMALDSQLANRLERWDGAIDKFTEIIPTILNSYLYLHYKEYFVVNKPKYINRVISETGLSGVESRVINVIKSMTSTKSEFYLMDVLQMVDEKNKDLVIVGLESVIEKKLIIPSP